MQNKLVLSSLALDLKRVALGLQRESYRMAERFTQEVLSRKNEVNRSTLKPYMRSILEKLDTVLADTDRQKKAEDSLMYSTLIQNYVLHN